MASSRGARRVRATPVQAQAPRHSFLFVAAILLAGVATYWNSLDGPFVWDDQTAIVTNQTVRSLWDAWSPPRETPVAGRPLVNFSFALNYAAGGLDVTGYHAGNIAVHLACALLLFGIVRRTLQTVRLKADTTPEATDATFGTVRLRADAPSRPDAIALVAALLWLLHPIQSEAVDYVTERTESMMGLFFFLTLYCAIRARRSAARTRWEAAAIASCVLGMASKETMVTAPIVVLLYDRVFEFDSFDDALRARKHLYAGLAASWLLLGWLMWRAARSTIGLTGTVGPWTSLLNQMPLIVQYLWLMVWPRALVLDYGLPRALSFGDVAPHALVVAALVTASLVALVRWPKVGFLPVTFFLTLAPSSSLVPVLTEVGAERRMYVPSAALAVLAVVTAWGLLQRLIARYPHRSRALAAGATGLVVVILSALAVRTMLRNQEYDSPLTLWRTVLDRRPHGRAHYALATELMAANRQAEAMSELNEAVRDFPDARYALGTELFAAGNVEQAIIELQEFIRAQPSNPNRVPGRLLLGQIFIAQGKLDDAARQFQTILDGDGSNALAREGLSAVGLAHRDLAEKLIREGDAGKAEVHARAAVQLLPRDAVAGNLLGVALASQTRFDEAIAQFQEVLRINPLDQQARNNLAHALGLARGPAR